MKPFLSTKNTVADERKTCAVLNAMSMAEIYLNGVECADKIVDQNGQGRSFIPWGVYTIQNGRYATFQKR